eukprot:GFKZ01000504.1.p1 GENE.GFKZ01000504.1~~GFKZ01000504.1.p1  ORF type:complete len:507 (-),score=71.88 GFKZ01000504.1:1297-2817(-)
MGSHLPPTYSASVKESHSAFRDSLFSPTFTPLPTLNPVITRLSNLLVLPLTAQSPPLSILLVGPQSCGKSLSLTRALSALPPPAQPTVVTLHGLLHSSPSSAWRAVASQLSGQDAPTHQAECLATVNHHLRKLATNDKPLLFILDAFHAFACDPASQSVLYGILNYLQEHTLRAACVAMTTKIDTTSRLEKRVKSRFAAREVVIPLPQHHGHVREFLTAALRHSLSPQSPSTHNPHRNGPPAPAKRRRPKPAAPAVSTLSPRAKRRRGSGRLRTSGSDDIDGERDRETVDAAEAGGRFGRERGLADYRCVVEMMIDSEESKDIITRYMDGNRVIEPILRAVDAAMASAFEDEIMETVKTGRNDCAVTKEKRLRVALRMLRTQLSPVDTLSTMVASVSRVELALLIALRRIKGKATFADVIKMYETLGREGGMVRGEQGEAIVDRLVAEKCWERLVEGGLVVRNGNGPKVLRRVDLAVEAEVIDQVIKQPGRASTRLERWAREEFRK